MRTFIVMGLILLASFKPATADDLPPIEGRVVDEKGDPVNGASVDFLWRANGSDKDENGKPNRPDR